MAPVSICPMDVVEAPIEKVWAILMDSTKYGEWSDLEDPTITPPGPTAPGQVLESKTSEFGLTFRARLVVREVNADYHRVGFDVDLMPMGIHNAASITLTALGPDTTRVAYGWNFTFPPGWRGWLVQSLLGRTLEPEVKKSLAQLKAAAEAA